MGLGSSKPTAQKPSVFDPNPPRIYEPNKDGGSADKGRQGGAVLKERDGGFGSGGVFHTPNGGAHKTRAQRKKARKTLKSRKN